MGSTFQEKFLFTLIEGLTELNHAVWNNNNLTLDDFISSGKRLIYQKRVMHELCGIHERWSKLGGREHIVDYYMSEIEMQSCMMQSVLFNS